MQSRDVLKQVRLTRDKSRDVAQQQIKSWHDLALVSLIRKVMDRLEMFSNISGSSENRFQIDQKNRFGYDQKFSKLLIKAWQATPFFWKVYCIAKSKKIDDF